MHTLRRAGAADFALLYDLLNVSSREKLLVEPLPPKDEFLRLSDQQLKAGDEHYYLLETDGSAVGLIRILIPQESCEIWGKSLATLYYHCGRIAFEQLGMSRLHWWVRHNNRRMIRICEMFGAQKTGEQAFFNFSNKLSFLAAGIVNHYEFTPSDFRGHIAIMEKYALPLSNIFEK